MKFQVVLIFGIMGACRGAELTNLTVDDVMDRDDVLIVKLRETKNKTTRSFTIEGEFLKTVKKYQALRLQRTASDRFFVNYRDGYCTNQVIGKNKLGGMPKEIAQFLKLPNPEGYTGHSFRRSSATLIADEGNIFQTFISNCKRYCKNCFSKLPIFVCFVFQFRR